MRLVHHSIGHIIVHLTLFTGFAMLVPAIALALEENTTPWLASPLSFGAGSILIIASILILFEVKESISSMLRSLGITMFIPGVITTLSQVLNIPSLLRSTGTLTGFVILNDISQFYIEHAAPKVIEVAAAYLAIGGMLYWLGTQMKTVKEKIFSYNQR